MIEQIREALLTEARGIEELAERVDDNFVKMVEMVYATKGRVVIAGIGKSGLVGRKIVATLISTGTNAIFLHPVEAMHGDLGLVREEDIFIGMSNSGETVELNILLPNIRKIGCPMIALTGKVNSTLARESDLVVNVGVSKEACPLGLAPMASTTALLAAGDALAAALIHKREFKPTDFKKFHPGGALGQRLSMRVKDLMLPVDKAPRVCPKSSLKEAVCEMDKASLGVVFMLDLSDNTLMGILTDGDVRHLVASGNIAREMTEEVVTRMPLRVAPDSPVYDALNLMEEREITVLPVVNEDDRMVGMLHLHDILGKGEFKFNGA